MPDAPAPHRDAKVLLIGWDAADWKTIHPLLDAGKMPALARLVERGVIGNLATLDPPLSPMLWTSIATGHTADRHGVLGFTQANATGTGLVPVHGTSRTVKALWNMLTQSGLRSNVVSWWPSHPAEPIDGAMVSNFFHRAHGAPWTDWAVPPGAVHPPELAPILAGLRVHPAEITEAQIAPFLPFLAETGTDDLEPTDQKRVTQLAQILADASTTQAVTTWLMEHTEWDLTAVYFDAIDHFGHGFMKFHPPQLPGLDDALFERYRHVVEAGYRFHDLMLDRLVELAGPETTVVLVSDHGFHSDHLRPLALPKEPAAPAYEHRQHGIVCLAGPGIRHDDRVYGATLLDVAPTVLSLFGLPTGEDMRGRPLVEAFVEPPALESIPTWEDVEGEAGRHPEGTVDPWGEKEALQQLVDLGYIDAPDETADPVGDARRESQFYLGRVYASTGRAAQALPIFERLVAEAPGEDRFALRLVTAYQALRRYDDARAALDAYEARLRERMAEQGTERRPVPGLHLQRGTLELAAGDVEAATPHLEAASRATPHFPTVHVRIGEAYLLAKRWTEAEAAMGRALAIDPDHPQALRGRALAQLRQGRPEEAAVDALDAVALQYHYPAAHFVLGEALATTGHHRRAAEAFEVALRQEPGLRRAHAWLAELYRNHLDDPQRATKHLRSAADA